MPHFLSAAALRATKRSGGLRSWCIGAVKKRTNAWHLGGYCPNLVKCLVSERKCLKRGERTRHAVVGQDAGDAETPPRQEEVSKFHGGQPRAWTGHGREQVGKVKWLLWAEEGREPKKKKRGPRRTGWDSHAATQAAESCDSMKKKTVREGKERVSDESRRSRSRALRGGGNISFPSEFFLTESLTPDRRRGETSTSRTAARRNRKAGGSKALLQPGNDPLIWQKKGGTKRQR